MSQSFRSEVALLSVLVCTLFVISGCYRVAVSPLSLAELQASPQVTPEKGRRSGENVSIAMARQSGGWLVTPSFRFEEAYDYRSATYTRCRTLNQGATRTVRNVAIGTLIGGLAMVGASYNEETESYMDDPNAALLIAGGVTSLLSTIGIIAPNRILKSNPGRRCSPIESRPYTLTELRDFQAVNYPWTLRIASLGGESILETEYPSLLPQVVTAEHFDACGLEDYVLFSEGLPSNVAREVVPLVVTMTIQDGSRSFENSIRYPMTFVKREALRAAQSEAYRAELERALEQGVVRFIQSGQMSFRITMGSSRTDSELKEALFQSVHSKEICGERLPDSAQQLKDKLWSDWNDAYVPCLSGECLPHEGMLIVPIEQPFMLRFEALPSLRWEMVAHAGGEVTWKPLGLAQLVGGEWLEPESPRTFSVKPPSVRVPQRAALHSTKGSSGTGVWADGVTPFYEPPVCEVAHQVCAVQHEVSYIHCPDAVCTNIDANYSAHSGFGQWAQTVRQIEGDLGLSDRSNFPNVQTLSFRKLEYIGGSVDIEEIDVFSRSRRPRFNFPRLRYLGALNVDPEKLHLAGLVEPAVYSFPELHELGSMTISGHLMRSFLRVLTPKLQRVQGDLRITETFMESSRLAALTGKLKEVGGTLELRTVLDLTSLGGLENLRVVHGDLIIQNIPGLKSLEGLKNLECVKGSLIIGENASLSSLRGLRRLRSVGSPTCDTRASDALAAVVQISNNASLRSLDGLESIQQIHGSVHIEGNVSLNDITALRRLRAPAFILRWNKAVTRFSGAFEQVESGAAVCWIDEHTKERVGMTPCFLIGD